jgi:hypothetical protein
MGVPFVELTSSNRTYQIKNQNLITTADRKMIADTKSGETLKKAKEDEKAAKVAQTIACLLAFCVCVSIATCVAGKPYLDSV